MKAIAVVVLLAGLVVCLDAQENSDIMQKLEANSQACRQEVNVDQALIDKLQKHEFIEDNNLKCFLKCLYVKMGYMNDSGELKADELKKTYPPTMDKGRVSEIVDKCVLIKGNEACETAFNVNKCLMSALPL